MSKIYLPIGISGSGKSTWAKSHISLCDIPKTVIISRDSIRMALFGLDNTTYKEYYSEPNLDLYKKEQTVTNFFDNQIWYALQQGFDVIADNTHLQNKYINSYKTFGVQLEPVIFDVDVQTAIDRDLGRDKTVGSDVIRKQQESFLSLMKTGFLKDVSDYNETVYDIHLKSTKIPHDVTKPNAIIFDIDGTIALKGDRGIHDLSLVGLDNPNYPVQYARNAIEYRNKRVKTDGEVIICSGREETCRRETENWLKTHNQCYKKLYMRPAGDYRKDWIIKAEFWADIQKNYNIVAMYDDRDQVVHVGRRLGYTMFQVAYGSF